MFAFCFMEWGETWVDLVRRPLIGLLYQPRMIDDDCGTVGGMRIVMKVMYSEKNPFPCHFLPPKSHMTWSGIEPWPPRLTAWAMAVYGMVGWTRLVGQKLQFLAINVAIQYPAVFITDLKLRGCSPPANYTDRATAACRRS
jgi:hypothetical protein